MLTMIGTRALSDALQGYDHMMWGGGYGIGRALLGLIFWGLIIALIVFVTWWLATGGRRLIRDDNALAILRERFAKGEIDEEEFERRRRALDAG